MRRAQLKRTTMWKKPTRQQRSHLKHLAATRSPALTKDALNDAIARFKMLRNKATQRQADRTARRQTPQLEQITQPPENLPQFSYPPPQEMPRANKQITLTQYTKRTRGQEDSTNHMPMLKLANTEIATTHQTQGTPQQDTTQAQQETKRPMSPTSAAEGKRHYTKITNTTAQLSNKRPPDAEMERTLPGPHQPCARRARSALEHPQPPKLLTLNVRGILANYNTVKNIIDSHQPDVIFLSKIRNTTCRPSCATMPSTAALILPFDTAPG